MSDHPKYPKRLIEVDLPIKRISVHARREKSIRHGHISTLHIWWARRPLAACRAVICAALWPDPADPDCPADFREHARKEMLAWTSHERQKLLSEESRKRFEAARQKAILFESGEELRGALLDFIADFANWDNSTIQEFLNTSRALTQAAHESLGGAPGTRPLVVDPFAGGGSIPLEALRVGADAFASDLNPIPVLLNKVVLEYIPKFGQRLAEEVRKWGEWIKQEAQKELAEFYPRDPDGATPIAYLWARTIISAAPGETQPPVEIPLLRSMVLARRGKQVHALRWVRDKKGQIETEIVKRRYSDGILHVLRRPLLEICDTPSDGGTTRAGSATCPVTGLTTPVERVREQFVDRLGGSSDARLLCVVKTHPNKSGRSYREPTDEDQIAFDSSLRELAKRISAHKTDDSLIPTGALNHLRGFFNVVLYGMSRWSDLFSPRQLLGLTIIAGYVRKAGKVACAEDKMKGVAIQTLLGLALDRLAAQYSTLSWWQPNGEFCVGTFGRQALPMVWDFCEIQPFAGASGDYLGAIDWICRVLESESSTGQVTGQVVQCSATANPLPDDAAEAIVTDPPYYAAIPYADLSDFFYSWLKRSIGDVHPDLFKNELAPKDDECVSLAHRAAMYRHKNGAWFETMMTKACEEARRITKSSGIGVFVFANKETSGWEAMLAALIGSGWIITASWPIDTERGGRMRARNSAVLGSSVHLICRPREDLGGSSQTDDIGDWRDVLAELPRRIHEWMPRLAEEGVVGADAIFACLGPALEIFSRYSRVEKASGEVVTLKEYLVPVWAAVAREALTMIFTGADATGFEEDARLTAMWLWTLQTGDANGADSQAEEEGDNEESVAKKGKAGGYILEYDAARKIAQGIGAHLPNLTGVVEVGGETARLLPVAERAAHLFGKDEGKAMPVRKKKKPQLDLFKGLQVAEEAEPTFGEAEVSRVGDTVLDRVHQSMILFAGGRSEALRRFLVDDGAGTDQRFWRLAQALSALYPGNTDEKRWVDGVLARKKGLGL